MQACVSKLTGRYKIVLKRIEKGTKEEQKGIATITEKLSK
jgi:hypothetical protein